jgi:hypothetical protein
MSQSEADPRARFTEMSPAERTALMVARINSAPLAPYAEGKYVLRIIEVPGRVSGELRATPIAVVQLDDKRYLCAPNRRRDWVRNLLAAGTCKLAADEPEYRVSLVDGAEGSPVVRTYLSQLGRVSEEWPFPGDSSVEEISKHADTTAVLRIDHV